MLEQAIWTGDSRELRWVLHPKQLTEAKVSLWIECVWRDEKLTTRASVVCTEPKSKSAAAILPAEQQQPIGACIG